MTEVTLISDPSIQHCIRLYLSRPLQCVFLRDIRGHVRSAWGLTDGQVGTCVPLCLPDYLKAVVDENDRREHCAQSHSFFFTCISLTVRLFLSVFVVNDIAEKGGMGCW